MITYGLHRVHWSPAYKRVVIERNGQLVAMMVTTVSPFTNAAAVAARMDRQDKVVTASRRATTPEQRV